MNSSKDDPTPRPLHYTIEVWNAPGHSTAMSGVGTVEEVAALLRAEADLLTPSKRVSESTINVTNVTESAEAVLTAKQWSRIERYIAQGGF